MDITYLGHASFLVKINNNAVIFDPWFSKKGAFNRSWFQFPKNHHCLNLVINMTRGINTAIYVSHEHQDHFCIESLKELSKTIHTVIIPKYKIKDFLSGIEECGFDKVIELSESEPYIFGDFKIELFIDEKGINRDSAILVNNIKTDYNFLNFNDCKIFDRLEFIKEKYKKIDVFTCQYSGATMHPVCYEYDEATYAEISKRKKLSKFLQVKIAIKKLEPDIYIPSAGPPVFLDPELFHVNFEPDNVFPKSWEFLSYLDKYNLKSQVLLLSPGDTLDAEVSSNNLGNEVDEENYEDYLLNYKNAIYEKIIVDEVNIDNFMKKLIVNVKNKYNAFNIHRNKLTAPNNFYFKIDEYDNYIKIDFINDKVTEVECLQDEDYYLHKTNINSIYSVIEGKLDWNSYCLTFRFKNIRKPDEYDSVISLFMFSNDYEQFEFGLKMLAEFKNSVDKINIQLSDNKTTCTISRYCPHQGADLKYALIENDILVCPRHHWKFDLRDGGKCILNKDTINAKIFKK